MPTSLHQLLALSLQQVAAEMRVQRQAHSDILNNVLYHRGQQWPQVSMSPITSEPTVSVTYIDPIDDGSDELTD